MSESLLAGIKLAVIMAAAALFAGLHTTPAITVLGGIALVAVLFTFEGERVHSIPESAAFGLTGGFAASLICTPFSSGLPVFDPNFPGPAEAWFVIAIVIFLIDRLRTPASAPPYAAALPRQNVSASVPVATAGPRLVREETPPAPAAVPPVAAPPVPATPPAPPPEPEPVSTAAPPAPQPQGIPLKGGKPAEIYVNLLGEGMVMLRPVRAEHIGRDYYHIIEEMPANERWEFTPGQVVRCQKKNLSSGKAMVAVEEAPRAQ